MLIQVFYILLFYLLGELVSYVMGGFVPGSIIGMILLFLALAFRAVKPENIGKISKALTDNMGLFFVPAGVGLMTSFGIISEYWAVILVSSSVSTVLVIVTVGYIQQFMERKGNKR
jgi:holin-like protein